MAEFLQRNNLERVCGLSSAENRRSTRSCCCPQTERAKLFLKKKLKKFNTTSLNLYLKNHQFVLSSHFNNSKWSNENVLYKFCILIKKVSRNKLNSRSLENCNHAYLTISHSFKKTTLLIWAPIVITMTFKPSSFFRFI